MTHVEGIISGCRALAAGPMLSNTNNQVMLIFQIVNTLGLLFLLYLGFRLVRYLWVKTRRPAPLDEAMRNKIKSL